MVNQLEKQTNARINGNWEEVLSKLIKGDHNVMESELIERIITANSQAAQAEFFRGGRNVDVSTASTLQTSFQIGPVIVRGFWWGFQIEINHEALSVLINAADPINTLINAIGTNIPSSIKPWIKLAAVFIAGALNQLKTADQGRGVYVSMSWFVPGIFVVTSV